MQERFFWLIVFVMSGFLLYLLSPVLTPFLFAAVLAYLGDPLVDRIEACKIPRLWAVVTLFALLLIGFAVIVLVIIPMIDQQVDQISGRVPNYLNHVQKVMTPTIQKLFDISPETINADNAQKFLQDNIKSASAVLNGLFSSLKKPARAVITGVMYLFLIPVVTFYLLRDWDKLLAKFQALLPRKYHDDICLLARRSDEVLGGFLRGQFIVMCCLGIIYAIGLSIVGLDLGILIGFFSGLVSFVPYLGLVVGMSISALVALIQFQDWLHLFAIAAVFICGQMMEGMFLTPKFVGDRTGLHPVAVLFAVLTGGQFFGFMGVLLALPCAAVINVFLISMKEYYLKSDVYQRKDSNL